MQIPAKPLALTSGTSAVSSSSGGAGTGAGNKRGRKFEVFISYRRSTGSQLAQLLKVYLRSKGFRAFLDVDNLEQGAFDQQLMQIIRGCTNFVVILSKESLNRCMLKAKGCDSDWVRREIAFALELGKNVVPVFTPDFAWPKPEELPTDMHKLFKHNSVPWDHHYAEAAVDKLAGFLFKDGMDYSR